MKKLLTIVALFFRLVGLGQSDPVVWQYTYKKISKNIFEIHLIATIQSPWHLYSQMTPAGGPVASVIQFKINPLIILSGKTGETGKMVTKHEKVFDVDVKYYEGQVDFVQAVELKAKVKTNVTGSIKYMVCDDERCLAPKEVNFTINLN